MANASTPKTPWFDAASEAPLLAEYARKLDSFLDAVADGKVTSRELETQEERVVGLVHQGGLELALGGVPAAPLHLEHRLAEALPGLGRLALLLLAGLALLGLALLGVAELRLALGTVDVGHDDVDEHDDRDAEHGDDDTERSHVFHPGPPR